MDDFSVNNPDDDPVQPVEDNANGGIVLDVCVVCALFSLIVYGPMLLL